MSGEMFADRYGYPQDADEVAQRLYCADCPSEVRNTGHRFRVIHTETCPAWRRYQQKLPGYTAMPSGVLVMAGDQPPEGTTVLLSNRSPGAPCGTTVTHRGPYKRARGAA